MIDLKGKKIGILGLGEENIALAKYLLDRHLNFVICDQKKAGELGEISEQVKNWPVDFRLGPDYLRDLKDFDLVFRTPGLPYFHPKIQAAKAAGVKIFSQTKFFFSACPCPIIGITGTKGKGTTATLISEILKKSPIANRQSQIFLGGNIGHPPIIFLDQLKKNDLVVLELSSFQLQDLHQSPHLAVILDIKVDHLDYHKDEKEYIEAKGNIVRFQEKSDFAVINADYLTSFELGLLSSGEVFWFSRRKSIDQGVWVKNGQEFILRYQNKEYPIIKTADVRLRGEHNWENIAAAAATSFLAGVDLDSIRKTIESFPGLEHRLEFIAQINGVKFYNDSFSTTPDTAIAAITSFGEPIVLIAGGSEKGADYTGLGKAIVSSKVKTVILIGKTGPKIKEKIQSSLRRKKKKIKLIDKIENFKKAVSEARKEAKPGDVILLSPASASFDWFRDYKDRGNQFKSLVVGEF